MIPSLYPCFKHWSEKGSVYITSDTHFKDNDREFMGYDISSIDQAYLLKEKCNKNDTLIHLGDVGEPEYMNLIRCHKVLIMGNHDQSKSKMEKYFDEVYPGPLWISEKIVLSHEPIEVSVYGSPCVLNIHGHDHSDKEYNDDYHLNLAANVFGYMPLDLKRFIKQGFLSDIQSIHRVTIDNATERKKINKDILKEWYFDTGIENI